MARANELRLGTRGSQLALWQANTVATRIADLGGPPCRLVIIKTSGDHLQNAQLSEVGGKRLFVKELEDALLRAEIDLAVHSSKDMPALLPEGLAIAAALPREDPRDAVVLPIRLKPDPTSEAVVPPIRLERDPTREGAARPDQIAVVGSGFSRTLEDIDVIVTALGKAPSIGTGSVRRVAQLARLVPHARFLTIRGNLDTRLRKLDEGQYDALILAAAGLRRLGFESRISLALPATACVPAPGQGIVAVEIRSHDDETRQAVRAIDDALSNAALTAERAVVAGLGGGCQTPIGALASPGERESLDLVAVVVAPDGRRGVRAEASGPWRDAEALGSRVARKLMEQGADEILAESRLK